LKLASSQFSKEDFKKLNPRNKLVPLNKLIHLMDMDSKSRHIVVSELNYENLKELGRKGDSFDDVISKLLRKQKYGF